MPLAVPERWGAVNRIQIELSFFGLLSVNISRIEPMNISSITFYQGDDLIRVEIKGDTVLDLTSRDAWIVKVTGYWKSFEI